MPCFMCNVSLTYTLASLVIFKKENFFFCYPSEILLSNSGENGIACLGFLSNYSVFSFLGIFSHSMLWCILLGIFPGFLWASPLHYPNELQMRLEQEETIALHKAIFMFDEEDTLPKLVQYKHTPAGKRRTGMGIAIFFLFTDFRFTST